MAATALEHPNAELRQGFLGLGGANDTQVGANGIGVACSELHLGDEGEDEDQRAGDVSGDHAKPGPLDRELGSVVVEPVGADISTFRPSNSGVEQSPLPWQKIFIRD